MLSENVGYLHKTMQMGCRDLSMRTGTRKLARLYLTRKLNDDLEMHESE